jgi:glucosamine--fructose-6-phosphate aminotransferase (isomerizing)
MCGIVGIIGNAEVAPLLLDGLRRLEYRGYDSAGIATLVDGRIERRRAEGKLANLAKRLDSSPLPGAIGIAHTRWATHGRPSEVNAHPHATDRVAVAHNGIIENFRALREELEQAGRKFETETDSETVAHLLSHYLNQGLDPETAMAKLMLRLNGAFSLAILIAGRSDIMIGARRGSPLAVGYGSGEMYLGSDAMALAPYTDRICYLHEDDWAVVSRDAVAIYNNGERVERETKQVALSGALVGKGEYRHFMMKEIAEQPDAVADTLRAFIQPLGRSIQLPELPIDLAKVSQLTIVACGTAYLAGLVAKYWLERIARLPVELDIASEFRYREPPMPRDGATLVISQSGETADTLAALRYARGQGQKVIAVLNAPESTIGRESDGVLHTRAGPEIGVASTKAFTTQLIVLAALTIAMARSRGTIDAKREADLSIALTEVPSRIAEVLSHDARLKEIALKVAECRDVLFLGRGSSYPIALEGALKLKETSYIHAEGYAAGEMKHGPIALIDDNVPVIVVAPPDDLFEKTASNLQEVRARGGRVIFLSDRTGIEKLGLGAAAAIELPTVDPFVAPIIYAVPVQLLAYHVAVAKGTDVDQPRNLAKSVTVE